MQNSLDHDARKSVTTTTSSFKCPICFEKFNRSCHQPISIECGHSFCLYCLQQIAGNATSFDCVICRRLINTEPNQFSKNILIIELLEHAQLLGNEVPCMELDCSVCNPRQPEQIEASENSEKIDEEMIDQLISDLEIFLQQRPETVAFMVESCGRQAERRLLDAFFGLIDECTEERAKVLGVANNFDDRASQEAESRQVANYARQFERLCVYMIVTILRFRTLNSFTVYAVQRIRAYFPLRNVLEFVELTHNNPVELSLNSRRLEDHLRRSAYSSSVYMPILSGQFSHDTNCDFIEYIPTLQLYHCLICNTLAYSSVHSNSFGEHIQELTHLSLLREVEYLPLEILRRRSNAYRICTQANSDFVRRASQSSSNSYRTTLVDHET